MVKLPLKVRTGNFEGIATFSSFLIHVEISPNILLEGAFEVSLNNTYMESSALACTLSRVHIMDVKVASVQSFCPPPNLDFLLLGNHLSISIKINVNQYSN